MVSADACKQHRDVPRAVRYLADVAWWVRPWWPNEIGHAQDNAGRARMGLKPDRVDAAMVRLQGLTRR
ncbi:hypothetical protein HMPREF0063_11928 [Aeromicrobium marinum DSM 15272]|uniref:Uncharacterized protein n=1 Tax=Aeromicrobium marinum DSM 15272 TaxID=585531 RepID=E2SDZ2_9ACTN|nr:hypothetical protein HMPREF0063_11928 [Aeromicrobium marinum DSM 15272]